MNKPRLSLAMISNRPEKILRLLDSAKVGFRTVTDVELALSHQSPVCDFIPEISAACEELGWRFVHERLEIREGLLVNLAKAREHSWSLANGKFVLICDDDVIFQAGTRKAEYSSSCRINDALEFIEERASAGERAIISMNSFFGGNHSGRGFIRREKLVISTNFGIILEKLGQRLIDEKLSLPAAGEDYAIFVTQQAYGAVAYKGFNAVSRMDKVKKTDEPGHPNYARAYTENNIIGAIRQHFPEFKLDERWLPSK